jgi:hypothetical protein
MSSVEGALLRAAAHGGPRRLFEGARFPTVLVSGRAAIRGVHLRSQAVGYLSGYRLASWLNGRERR